MSTEKTRFPSLERFPPIPNDGRLSIAGLYKQYFELVTKHNFGYRLIYPHEVNDTLVPSYAFYTPQKGPALWLITGIHAGKEPTGPNAFALNISLLGQFGQTFPLVVMPLCNPLAYIGGFYRLRNFSNSRGLSVCDADYWLSHPVFPSHRRSNYSSPESKAFCNLIMDLAKLYPPIHCVDLHDDFHDPNNLLPPNHFLNGDSDIAEQIATFYVKTLLAAGVNHIHWRGTTLAGDKVRGGIQRNTPDSSIDELIYALGCPLVFTSEMYFTHSLQTKISAVKEFLKAIFYAHRTLYTNLVNLYSDTPKNRPKIIK